MTDHNKTRAFYLLQLEKDRLISLRKIQAASGKRAVLRRDCCAYAVLGLIACALGFIAGRPEIHLFTLVAFACAFFCGRSLPEYKNYGDMIEDYKKHEDWLTRRIDLQRQVTDLTCVHSKISLLLSDIRAHTQAVVMDLRGRG